MVDVLEEFQIMIVEQTSDYAPDEGEDDESGQEEWVQKE